MCTLHACTYIVYMYIHELWSVGIYSCIQYLCKQFSVFLCQEGEGRLEALGHQAQL